MNKNPEHNSIVKIEGPCACETSDDRLAHIWKYRLKVAGKRKKVEELKSKYRQEKTGRTCKNVPRIRRPRQSAVINKARNLRNNRRRLER